MSKIIIDKEQWDKLVVSYLLDVLINYKDMLENNDDWGKIVDKIKLAGVKPHLIQAYLHQTAEERTNYKRIKDVFYKESDTMYTIYIKGKSTTNEDVLHKYKLKDTIREVVRIIGKERRKSGLELNGEKLDRIIETVIIKQEKFEKGEY